jgi:oligosaccharide reducing-end xylanase
MMYLIRRILTFPLYKSFVLGLRSITGNRLLGVFSLLSLFAMSSCSAHLPPSRNNTPTSQSTHSPFPYYQTNAYRDFFQYYLGKSQEEVADKINRGWQQLFYGDDATERIYYPVGTDMAYILDVGNGDVRTEGMSYGMMIAVQLNRKEEFDRLWKWTKTYMYQSEGPFRGYFAWHCTPEGQKLASNPASDGEEWFVMALLFAAHRWGNGEGMFNYREEAQQILNTMLHKSEENNGLATNMFDAESKQVVFVPSGRYATFTNPSYHLPFYYELWARWAAQDNDFWYEAAQASRAFFRKAAHPQTGLMPDYANFDGSPVSDPEHEDFRFDAWRTLANVAVDYAWFGVDPWQIEQSNRVLDFLASHGIHTFPNQYTLEGTPLSSDHSTGLVAMAAVAGMIADPQKGQPFIEALWNADIPTGKWRYYDGMLYLLGLLHVSGNFRIY